MPVTWGSKWTALYCVEAPDVIFLQQLEVPLVGRETCVEIDWRFTEVCKKDSIGVYGICGDGGPVWARVIDQDYLAIQRPYLFNKSNKANVLLVGLRGDCDQNRWPEMTKEQFEHNEERIKSFMPRD